MRKLVKGLAGHQHPPQRFNRQFHSSQLRHLRGPGPGAIHNLAGRYPAAGGFN